MRRGALQAHVDYLLNRCGGRKYGSLQGSSAAGDFQPQFSMTTRLRNNLCAAHTFTAGGIVLSRAKPTWRNTLVSLANDAERRQHTEPGGYTHQGREVAISPCVADLRRIYKRRG